MLGDQKQVTRLEDVRRLWFTAKHSFKEGYKDGALLPFELGSDFPFAPKRMSYVYDTPEGSVRGNHAHHTTEQVLICLSGQIDVICHDGKSKKIYSLESPTQGLYIPSMIWDECVYTLQNSVLLVLSSTSYDPKDYITDYQQFLELKKA